MDLKTKVVRNGKIVGVRIVDGAMEYPIVLEALRTEDIFTRLKEAGWVLSGLPHDFRKQGKTINDLPAEDYNSLPDDERDDFYSFEGEILPDNELAKHIPKQAANYVKWANPLYAIIKTRDDLLMFLRSSQNKAFAVSDPTSYLPLNAFCNHEALFTPAEFVDPANAEYVRLIEARRALSFTAYRELVEFFISMGMSQSYDAVEFLKRYYSWGICGINANCLKQEEEESPIRLGQNQLGMKSAVYMQDSKYALITREGEIIPKIEPGWKQTSKVEYFTLKKDEATIVSLTKEVTDHVIIFTCEDMTAKFSATNLEIRVYSNAAVRSPLSVRVRYPFSFNYIQPQYWNIKEQANLEEITNTLFATGLAQEFIDKITVRSDASSLKALRNIGMTERGAMDYIINKMCAAQPIGAEGGVDNDEINTYRMIQQGLDSYLAGSEDVAAPNYIGNTGLLEPSEEKDYGADIEDFVISVRDGSMNIDDTQMGADLDSKNSKTELIRQFKVALSILGCTKEELYAQVSKFSLHGAETGTLRILGSTGLFIDIPVIRGDYQVSGYLRDLDKYNVMAADTAQLWINITRVYTEPTTDERARHVAVAYQSYGHCNYNSRGMSLQHYEIENQITEILEACIRNLPTREEREVAKMKMPGYVARMVFAIHNSPTNVVGLPESLGGAPVQIPMNLFNYLKSPKVIFNKYESLLGICDAITDKGVFNYFCNNAILSPDLIIPYKGVKIEEWPFLQNWADTTGQEARRNEWIKAGYIPQDNLYGMRKKYREHRGNNTGDIYESPYSLDKYFTHLLNTRKVYVEEKDKQLAALPTLAELAYPESYPELPKTPCTPEEFKENFTCKPGRIIDRETIEKEWPERINFAPVIYEEDDGPLRIRKGFKDIYELHADAIAKMGTAWVFRMLDTLSQKILVRFRTGDFVVFTDGFQFNWKDFQNTDLSNYAVESACGRVYFMDSRGKVFCREIETGVIMQ